MSLDVLFFVVFRQGLPGWHFEAGAPFRRNIGDGKNTPETIMVSGVIFSVAASDGFCPDCRLSLLFYGLRNSVGNLEHRHILLSTRAVENGLVVAMEVHHGS